MASKNFRTAVEIEINFWDIARNNYLTELRSFFGANLSVGDSSSENMIRKSSVNQLRWHVDTDGNNMNCHCRSTD